MKKLEIERLAIVGGVAVERGNVPWQANIRGMGGMCGATLVTMDVSLLVMVCFRFLTH